MPTVLLTGASRGLGLEFARQYAEAGWRVIATCRKPAEASALRALAERSADRMRVVALDVADPAATERLAEALRGTPLDILLANAGLLGPRDYSPGLDDAVWGEVMRVNVMAPLRLASLLTESVAASERRLMGFVSSRMGSMASNDSGGLYVYRSSKAALNAVVKNLAIDLAPRGITTVALHPGWVRTDMGGANADLDVATSVAGMVAVLGRMTAADSGRLINYTGEILPW